MDAFEIFLCSVVVITASFVGFVIYSDVTAEKISINKKDWSCTDYDMRTTLIATPSGAGGTIMIPTVTKVCTNYKRQ